MTGTNLILHKALILTQHSKHMYTHHSPTAASYTAQQTHVYTSQSHSSILTQHSKHMYTHHSPIAASYTAQQTHVYTSQSHSSILHSTANTCIHITVPQQHPTQHSKHMYTHHSPIAASYTAQQTHVYTSQSHSSILHSTTNTCIHITVPQQHPTQHSKHMYTHHSPTAAS